MTNSRNDIDKDLKSHSEPIQAPDDDNKTFIHAQLAYAKSKQGKAEKGKKKGFKKRWFKKGGSNEN